jgi:Bacterial SH3 domain
LRAQVQYQDVKDWVQKVLSGQPAPGVSPIPTTVLPTSTPKPIPTRTSEPSPTPQVMGTVKMGSRVRSGPSTDDAVLGGLVKGDQVLVLGASKDRAWLQILTPKGEPGWIFADLVTLTVDPADLPLSP